MQDYWERREEMWDDYFAKDDAIRERYASEALEIYNDEPEPDIVQQCIEDSRKRHKDEMNKSKIGQFVRAEYGYDVVGSVTYNDSRPRAATPVKTTKKKQKNKGKK